MYLDATLGAVSVMDWLDVVRKALTLAKEGDAKAREWLGKLLVGSDPIPLATLVEDLQEQLRRLKRVHASNQGSPAPNGGAAVHRSDQQPTAGPAAEGLGSDIHGGRNDAGPMADNPAAFPLFPPPAAMQ
jgi:hypothetical protein